VVTIAAAPRARAEGYVFAGASNPASGPFRAAARRRILKLAQDHDLVVPMAETFKFDDAPAAFAALTAPHPPDKLASTAPIITIAATAARRDGSEKMASGSMARP